MFVKNSYHRSIKRVARSLESGIMPRTIQWPTGNKIRETSDISGLLNVDESHKHRQQQRQKIEMHITFVRKITHWFI